MTLALQVSHMLRAKLRRGSVQSIEQVATRTWELAPGVSRRRPRAYFLPGQLERVTGWVFTDRHPRHEMEADVEEHHGPTLAAQLDDAWLIDGVLYKGAAVTHLRPRTSRWPQLSIDRELDDAAIYCTPQGNRWFGSWLIDDCARYELARREGVAVTTDQPISAHMRQYEAMLDMRPLRLKNAFLRRVVLFDDSGQNTDKHLRFRRLRERLVARGEPPAHAGVFLLRGAAGDRRVLRNEEALAERLQRTRGFQVLDPLKVDIATIVDVCAGARVVVAVEGSALAHAAVAARPGVGLLVLQPPDRFCNVFKHIADRDGHHFGFVVGVPEGQDFRIDADELERTLELLPPAD